MLSSHGDIELLPGQTEVPGRGERLGGADGAALPVLSLTARAGHRLHPVRLQVHLRDGDRDGDGRLVTSRPPSPPGPTAGPPDGRRRGL